MHTIPRAALFLGLAGVIPFLWGALTTRIDLFSQLTLAYFGPRFIGATVQQFYGAVILSFMSGALWGFSTNAKGKSAVICYTLSVLPALWVFFLTGDASKGTGQNLIFGFCGLLVLDWYFWSRGLAPIWWMKLRIILSILVIPLLAIGVYL